MSKQKLSIFMVFFMISMSVRAQTLSPVVLSSGGGYANQGGVQLNWTLGEAFTGTASVAGSILTQGAQQPELQIWAGTINMPWSNCAVSIPYTVSGVIDLANIFTAELSDANGNFANAIVLGTSTGTANGIINGTIPASVAAGTGYRIRVRSSLPSFTGLDNGTNLTVQKAVIPDTTAYANGTQPNTIYIGWSPGSSLVLTANPGGAVAPTYVWKNSANTTVGTARTLTVTTAGTYTVTITDQSGCFSSASKTVNAVNVSCAISKNTTGVTVCKKQGNNYTTTCVASNAVENALKAGGYLGACQTASVTMSKAVSGITMVAPEGMFNIRAFPNPTTSQFTVQLQSDNARDGIAVWVVNLNGTVVEQFTNLRAQQVIRLGTDYRPGMYVIEMRQGNNTTQLKVMKLPD